MVAQLEIVSKEFIKPSCPTPQTLKELKFSSLDQFVGTFNIPLIFFYQNQPSSNVNRAQKSLLLKKSLSDVLTKFYPLAGRINGDVSIICNDSGALYIEAQVNSPLSKAIQNVPVEELSSYVPLPPWVSDDDMSIKNVPLGVQVNFFECGGIAIGVSLSHRAGDAWTLVNFMTAWATICRGDDLIVQPNFNLGCHYFPTLDSQINLNADTNAIEEKIVMKRFVFDKEKLAALKELASSVSNGSQVHNPTRVEALSAFIWKNVIDVSQAKAGVKTAFSAIHTVNLRSRMNPPLPEFTMGNFSILTSGISTPEKNKDYHHLVGLVGKSIRKIKNVEKGVNYLSYLEKFDEQTTLKSCLFSSWCRFPTYEVDYGWGKPLSVCQTAMPSSGVVILMSTRCGDGIEAWISLTEDEMAMLPSDLLSLANNDFTK